MKQSGKSGFNKLVISIMRKRWFISFGILFTFVAITTGILLSIHSGVTVDGDWKEVLLLLLGAFIGSFSKVIDYWFSDGDSNEQIKIAVRFLSNEIRSDAIKIIIHKKKCESFSNCKINSIENATNNEIKLAILKSAAQLKKQDLVKTKEKNSDVKLPKNF